MIDHIIHLALRHRLWVFLVTLAICTAGVMSLTQLPIDAFPDISPNLVQVFAEIYGMAPEEVEQLVTRPVEIAIEPGDTLIFATDGIRSGFTGDLPQNGSAQEMADTIFQEYGRGTDDALVLVARYLDKESS